MIAWLDHRSRQAGRPDLGPARDRLRAPVLALVSAATVGVVLASRRPRHPVGWLLLLGRDSSLVVAAATLAVAGLFQPARRRVQAAVDRRFNRRRHDATRIIEGFGARPRDQVVLGTLTTDLLAVVDQTMQPTQASLWLRSPPEPPRALASP